MYKPLLKIVRLFILCLWCSLGFGQQYPSTHFDVRDGLPNNAVRTILRASNGVIWLGTDNGVAQLKNGKIKRFTHPDLPSAMVWDIQQDGDGAIWQGTYGKGLFKINDSTITKYDTSNGLISDYIRKIWVKDGAVLVGTENGLSVLKDDSFTNFEITEPNEKLQVQDFFEYRDEVYFITLRAGIYKIKNLASNPTIGQTTNTKHLFALGTSGNLAYVSKPKTIDVYKIENLIYGGKSLRSVPSSIVWDYAPVNENTVYSANWGAHTDDGGAYKLDLDNFQNQNKSYGIPSTAIWSILYDKELDVLYVGTLDDGLYRVDVSKKVLYNPTTEKVIGFMKNDSLTLLATAKQVSITTSQNHFKIDAQSFIKHAKDNFKPTEILGLQKLYRLRENINISRFKIHSVKQVQDNIWVATNLGIYKVDLLGNIKAYYPVLSEVFEVRPDGKLIAPVLYNGVFVFKSSTEFTFYKPQQHNTPIDVNSITTIGNTTYFLSRFIGLFSYDGNDFNHLIKDKTLSYMTTPNGDGNTYLAETSGTIIKYDLNSNTVIDTLSQKRYKGQSIQFLKYNKDRLLIGTERGVNIVTDSTEILIDQDQGITDLFVQNASISDNILSVGTNSGYYSINLNKFAIPKTDLDIQLDKVTVNYQPFTVDTKTIDLNPDQNTVLLSVSIPNHPYPNKLEYSYSIDGNKHIALLEPKLLLPLLPSGQHKVNLLVKDLHYGTTYSRNVLNIHIAQPVYQRWWFWMLVSLGVSGFVFGWFYFRLKRKNKQQQQLAEIEQRLTATKLEALQSQMNPHFTFNAMNSIQNYIIDNDVDNALYFMGEFSKLMRATLDHSAQSKITLEQELQYIQRYVLIENMRFGNRVQFEMNIDDCVEPSETFILPLLLQPIIENCFEHAFTTKIVNPKIALGIAEIGNKLQLTVTDNGKGLQKNKQASLHQSKGIKLITERLNLVQNIQNPIIIKSLENGTAVTITLDTATITNSI